MDFQFDTVTINGGFWKELADKNRKTTLYAVYDRFAETGRFEALKCNWKEGMPNRPHIFWDSDVAKWMEGVAYVIAKSPDPLLEARVEGMIDDIIASQWEDGYINSYYTAIEPENRFTNRNNHELYCIGHLIEAAVAYYYATGKDRFLKCMERAADCVYKIFVEEQSAAFVTPGHEEIEIALLRLYRATQKEKYLELCKFFINQRGNNPKDKQILREFLMRYEQSHVSVRELTLAEGHSVRAMYLYTAMADLAKEINDVDLENACKRLFEDVVERKMYITGGIGSTNIGEAFTVAYDLPAERAYTETCASIGLMLFSQKMLELCGDSVYADTVERAMYNGMLPGLSLDGVSFFYENPLEITLRDHHKNTSTVPRERYPITQRVKVFGCSCCPPNLNRLLSSMERFVYRVKGTTCYVDQYMTSVFHNDAMTVQVNTAYPSNGTVAVKVSGADKIALRIPAWCQQFTLNLPYTMEKGYAVVETAGKDTEISLNMEMLPTLYEANGEVNDAAGKVALMMGPIVYCIEGIDNQNVNLHRLAFSTTLNPEVQFAEEYGMNRICVDGYLCEESSTLYRPLADRYTPTRITLIPYYAFANRGESDMLVWMRYR